MTRRSPDKGDKAEASNFDFERMLKILSAIFLSVGTVIYSFCMGYFHRLEIPDNPSLVGAVEYYLSSLLKALYNQPYFIAATALIIAFLCFFWSNFSKWHENKALNRYGISALVAALLLIITCAIFRTTWLIAPPLICLASGIILFHKTVGTFSKEKDHTVSVLTHLGLVILTSLWSFSVINPEYFIAKPLNESFPVGFGIKPYEPSYLTWVEDNKKYWFSCQDIRGVIYGTNDSEQIFSRTEMSYNLYSHFCLPSK